MSAARVSCELLSTEATVLTMLAVVFTTSSPASTAPLLKLAELSMSLFADWEVLVPARSSLLNRLVAGKYKDMPRGPRAQAAMAPVCAMSFALHTQAEMMTGATDATLAPCEMLADAPSWNVHMPRAEPTIISEM